MSKSAGRALVVGSAACRNHARLALARSPFEVVHAEDPYAATAELCQRPLAYRAVVLCLSSVYREELGLITTIRRRFGHIDVFVSQTDGRAALLAEAVRLGAAGMLLEDGLHRLAADPASNDLPEVASDPADLPAQTRPGNSDGGERVPMEARPSADDSDRAPYDDLPPVEAVLSAEELRALLEEIPVSPAEPGEG